MEEVKVLPMASYALLLLWAVAGPLLAWRIVLVRERRARWFDVVGCSLLNNLSELLHWGQELLYRDMFGSPLDFYVFRNNGLEARVYPDQRVEIIRGGEVVDSGWMVEFTSHYGYGEFILADVPLEDMEPQEVAFVERRQAPFGRIDWCGHFNGITRKATAMNDGRRNKRMVEL